MSRAWAKTKPGLFTQWRLQHRSHDSGQAVRLSIYTALGSAPRRELRMKTLDMVVGGRNGVRLQDIMYPVQVTWHAMQRAKAQRWTLHKIVAQANLCTGRKIWTFAFEAAFSLKKNIAPLNPKPAQVMPRERKNQSWIMRSQTHPPLRISWLQPTQTWSVPQLHQGCILSGSRRSALGLAVVYSAAAGHHCAIETEQPWTLELWNSLSYQHL